MVDTETLPTNTIGSQTSREPTITQTQGISKSALCKAKPCSSTGKADSHDDAPLSLAKETVRCKLADKWEVKSLKTFTLSHARITIH